MRRHEPMWDGDKPLTDEEARMLAQEKLAADVAVSIEQRMHQCGLKQKDLANKMECSEAYVSQILSGKSNMTLRTLADVGGALGAEIRISLAAAEGRAGDETSISSDSSEQGEGGAPGSTERIYKPGEMAQRSPVCAEPAALPGYTRPSPNRNLPPAKATTKRRRRSPAKGAKTEKT